MAVPNHSNKPSPKRVPKAYQLSADERRRTRLIALRLDRWATRNLRDFPWRQYTSEYDVLVAEMLLQRTSAGAVARFIPQFLAEYPDWHAISTADSSRLRERLSVLGLQARRTASLIDFANARLGSSGERPGVGQYIERALGVMLKGARVAMVDANFVRILRRVFGPPWTSDYRYDRRLQGLALRIVLSAPDARVANLAILDFGALVCSARSPKCSDCPLLTICDFGKNRVRT